MIQQWDILLWNAFFVTNKEGVIGSIYQFLNLSRCFDTTSRIVADVEKSVSNMNVSSMVSMTLSTFVSNVRVEEFQKLYES